MHFYYHLYQRHVFKYPGIVNDTLSPPKPWWDYPLGVWSSSPLEQKATDVPGARTLWLPRKPLNTEGVIEMKPTLVDNVYRFTGVHVREFETLTHYMLGVYYKIGDARLREYKQYSGLPKMVTAISLPLSCDACLSDSAVVEAMPEMLVRGLSPRYSVKYVYHDDTYDTFTVPPTLTYVKAPPRKPIKRIEVYDRAGRLVIAKDELAGGLDDYYLGGPGTYVLLSDSPIAWNFDWAKLDFTIKRDELRCGLNEQFLSAYDYEFTSGGYLGMRCYESSAMFRGFVLKRW